MQHSPEKAPSESLKASQPKLLGRGAGTKNSNFSPKTDALHLGRLEGRDRANKLFDLRLPYAYLYLTVRVRKF